jgi:hypothetical protein
MNLMLQYIEKCTGANHTGPAWIGHVRTSKTGVTIYSNGRAFKRGSSDFGNHYDLETGDPFWISGIKRNGEDRHWAGSGAITIEADVVTEYLEITGQAELDPRRFIVSNEIEPPDPSKFVALENDSDALERLRFPGLDDDL